MITNHLKTICKDLKADRAILAKIHGVKTKEGTLSTDSAFSIMFEYCNNNTSSVKSLVQNVPMSVIKTEFGDNIDGIVVGDLNYSPHEKCTAHLNRLGITVIINQLLKVENYVWGILSLHFVCRPSFIKAGTIDPSFISLLQNYKQSILTSDYEIK